MTSNEIPGLAQAYGETMGVYAMLERLVAEAFAARRYEAGQTLNDWLAYVAQDVAEKLDEACRVQPALVTHERAWVVKKCHDVLSSALDQAFQQPFNKAMGLPTDYRG